MPLDCDLLEQGVNTSCEAEGKVGGINKRIFVGQISNIDADVLAFTDGAVSAFALLSGKTLKMFISDRFLQAGRDELVPNEFGRPTWKHIVDFVHMYWSQEDINALEQLARAKQLFCIIETNNGQFFVYGLGNTVLGYDNFGLKAETQTGTTGIKLADDVTGKTSLSGEVTNKPMLYKPTQDGAATAEELENMSEAFSS
jgi:hypothetical protein